MQCMQVIDMNKDEKAAKPKSGANSNAFILIAAAAVLFVAGVIYFSNAAPGQPPAPNGGGPAVNPLDSDAAKLLLGYYSKGANLTTYRLNYTENTNGVKTGYFVASDGKSVQVRISDEVSDISGYFNATTIMNSSQADIVCLKYGGKERCASVGNESDAKDIANGLKTRYPAKSAYLAQLEQMRKHVEIGAVKLSQKVVDEKVNGFDTSKISYTLDYSNLTVQQLRTIGISPNDPSLNMFTEQEWEYWIDKKTGLVVKSHASYRQNGAQKYMDVDYFEADISPREVGLPQSLATVEDFLMFYAASAEDFTTKQRCEVMASDARDQCFKNLAIDRGDVSLCSSVKSQDEHDKCVLIIAQQTQNSLLCEGLPKLADECYIAVVSETGNGELCKKLANQSLMGACSEAVAAGKKKQDELSAEREMAASMSNCGSDSNCWAVGQHKEFCVPKNSTSPKSVQNDPFVSCFAGVPCSCNSGYCGFAKNETYYKCINSVEEELLKGFINSLVANSTNNSTGNSSPK